MSLVSNFIGNISSIGAAGITAAQNFDLSDTTFEDLLNKQIEAKNEVNQKNGISELDLGMPAGMEIESLDIEPIEIYNNIQETDTEIRTTSETATFFSSLLDNKENPESEIFDFAKKQAANLYNKYSRSIVTDVAEFVEDIGNMI